jgi:hypothetical protein
MNINDQRDDTWHEARHGYKSARGILPPVEGELPEETVSRLRDDQIRVSILDAMSCVNGYPIAMLVDDVVEVYGYDSYCVKDKLWQMINSGKLILSSDRKVYPR